MIFILRTLADFPLLESLLQSPHPEFFSCPCFSEYSVLLSNWFDTQVSEAWIYLPHLTTSALARCGTQGILIKELNEAVVLEFQVHDRRAKIRVGGRVLASSLSRTGTASS